MRRFVEGIDREQATLFPEYLEDWIDKDNPVRAINAFVDKLDLSGPGVRWGCSRSNRPTFLSSIGTTEALHLRLSQSGSSPLSALSTTAGPQP
jgi:hypothetical protein